MDEDTLRFDSLTRMDMLYHGVQPETSEEHEEGVQVALLSVFYDLTSPEGVTRRFHLGIRKRFNMSESEDDMAGDMAKCGGIFQNLISMGYDVGAHEWDGADVLSFGPVDKSRYDGSDQGKSNLILPN